MKNSYLKYLAPIIDFLFIQNTPEKSDDIIHENIPPEIESAAEKLKIMFKNN